MVLLLQNTDVMKFFEAKHHAALYAKYRPTMPRIIVEKVVEFMRKSNSSFDCAVDVGCGNGQSTYGLGEHFSKVLGVDTSSSQISEANSINTTHNVKFEVGDGEKLSMSDNSVDLISSCMAAHWFDLPVFFKECARVLKQNGCLMLCAHSKPEFYPVSADLKPTQAKLVNLGQKALDNLCSNYTFHERVAHRDDCYDKIFKMIDAKKKVYEKDIEVRKKLDLENFVRYLSTWASYQNFTREAKSENQVDVLDAFAAELKEIWNMREFNNKEIPIFVIWKYFMVLTDRPST